MLQAVERLVGTRRDELVQFHPRDLAPSLDMDQTAVAHDLHELSELKAFTYVPPFRGRAIRMIRRDVPFDQLEIDFAALEQRKEAEIEKLNRMVRFALSGSCRQQEILRYFGEQRCPAVRPLRQLPQALDRGRKRGRRPRKRSTPSAAAEQRRR